MRKIVKFIFSLITISILFSAGTVLADKMVLWGNIVRLHVVANSDSQHDQNVKLTVRDAVLNYLQPCMDKMKNAGEAIEYLSTHVNDIEDIVENSLDQLGEDLTVSVILGKEAFPKRDYESFSLPAGIYNALQVKLGDGKGANWWCVVFPSLCMPSSFGEFSETAVMAGMDEGLAASLAGEERYKIRFFLLDCLGKMEKFVFAK